MKIRFVMSFFAAFSLLAFTADPILGQCAAYDPPTVSTGSIVPGTVDTGNHTDDSPTTPITLPFPVSFYGVSYTQATVCANGFLQFVPSGGSTAYTNLCLPTTTFSAPTMLPYWDDLYTTDSGQGEGIFTSISGSAPNRIFNIEWRTVYCCTGGAPINNFEIRLYENSTGFDFVYGAMADRSSATIGVQASSSGPMTQYSCNTSQSLQGRVLRFDCGVGACCFIDGSCQILSSGACTAQQGSYGGNNSTCSPNCQRPGACCFPTSPCAISSGPACTSAGGTYSGDGVTCANANCPPTNPFGSGSASPSPVNCGSTTLLRVTVTPGTNPASTGLTVTANLTSIGGSATQSLYDDGPGGGHGDATAGDNIFSFLASVPNPTSPGGKTLNFTIGDQQGRSGSGSISLNVTCIAPPNPTLGPDVVTWEITDVPRWGQDASATVTAYSVGTTSSNEGDYPVNWIDNSSYSPDYDVTRHPVISQNMYRLKVYGTSPNTYARFEQIGQSWLKHGFVSTNSPGGGGPNPCSTGTGGALGANLWRFPPTSNWQSVGGDVLSVGCTDTYGGGLNGSQGYLGAKNIVNATTGYSPWIEGNSTGDATVRGRLQVPSADVTTQPAGTRFYVDAWYVTQDDAQFVRPGQTVAINNLNSASWREITASTINSNPSFANSTQRHFPGIYAWQAADPSISLVTVDDDTYPNPGTGYRNADGSPQAGTFIRARFWVAAKATSLGGGLTRYEYAVYNHNHDRAGATFTVPLPAGATVSNISYHAPQWHSGEPYSNAAWTNARVGDTIVFSTTETYQQNQNANALRWGELMNFGFTTNVNPMTGNATLGLFKPGIPSSLSVAGIPIPGLACPASPDGDMNRDGRTDGDDIQSFVRAVLTNSTAAADVCVADFSGNGIVDAGDVATFAIRMFP